LLSLNARGIDPEILDSTLSVLLKHEADLQRVRRQLSVPGPGRLLDPEPPHLWGGDSDMPKYAPLCDQVLKVASPRELAAAVDLLLSK